MITDLDRQLQEIALKDWEQFVKMIGEDKIIKLKVCLLKSNGNTYGMIQRKLHLTKNKVQYACENCKG